MLGKDDWFCEMEGSEKITRTFRSWERYFSVWETHAFYIAHNKTQLFCESHESGTNFTYFHVLLNRILNLKHLP